MRALLLLLTFFQALGWSVFKNGGTGEHIERCRYKAGVYRESSPL